MKPEPTKTRPEATRKQPSKEEQPEVVQTSPRPPHQSQLDEERGDWEGMGQSRFQQGEDKPKSGPRTR